MNPAIVINAYNRPDSILRLLSGLQRAVINDEVPLVFSLEYGAHDDVVQQANDFKWPYGQKTIIRQEKKLGLIGHFLFCGGLTEQYGTIIYLEDDLFTGPDFYSYAKAVLKEYAQEEHLAGFSLNALWFNGYVHLPFLPVDDGNPCFFLQVPWYQGQIYTAAQWQHFRQWYDNFKGIDNSLQMHPILKKMNPADEWFGVKTQYLVETGKYYCFPRSAQCINFGDEGTHFKNKTNFFQTELAMNFGNGVFKSFHDCLAVYDSFFELLPDRLKRIAPHLQDIDFELDLNGTKDRSLVRNKYIITPVRPSHYIKKYALEMRPKELNIAYEIEGDSFFLAETEQVKSMTVPESVFYNQFLYYNRFKLTRKQKFALFLRK